MHWNRLLALAVAALLTAPLTAQRAQGPDKTTQGRASLPPEWQARFDSPFARPGSVGWENTGTGFRIKTGPAGIFYPPRPMSGAYETRATFTQLAESEDAEAYGLFIGGVDLQGEGQQYTYFLLNRNVRFLIKRRVGARTPTLVDWTPHPAIRKPDRSRQMTNTLSIEVGTARVRFLINGTEVASQPAAKIDTTGIAGLRINHSLNVQVEGFILKSATGR